MHLSGPVVDTIADYIAIVVLLVVPALLIYLFWIVHILPEKIAYQRGHPQADAIKTLCLLSLVFGGLLWPIAWLWAYSKPVLHQLAYGTDRVTHPGHGDEADKPTAPQPAAGAGGEADPAAAEAARVKRPAAARMD
jgi:CBS domain containing-hemolysin-like protein